MQYPPFQQTIGSPFIELQTVDSTNNYALTQIHAGLAQHGMVIFTHDQVAGKGQRGRNWVSSRDESITLSIIIKPSSLGVSEQFQLSACIAVATRHFCARHAGEDTKIKWPNDLYWKDRKAGGILVESVVRSSNSGAGSWEWAVAGIGINVNQTTFPSELANPVSLKQVTGRTFDVMALARELCRAIEDYYGLLTRDGFAPVWSEYVTHLYKKDEQVKLKKGNRVFEAIIKGVSPDGKLIVQRRMEEQFDYGEIQWMLS